MALTRRQFLAGSALSIILPSIGAYSSQSAYPHLRAWNFEETKKYGQWVSNMYEFKKNGNAKQKQARLNRILGDDEMNLLNHKDFLEQGNSQLNNSDLNFLDAVNHCGSFPKLLHLYYSYRRGLPAIVTKIKPGISGDIRYTSGNHPVNFIRSMPFEGSFRDFVLAGITSRGGGYNFVSGNFRTSPDLEETDSVPIAIDRKYLKPGAVGYNIEGHCLVVSKIDDSGEVHFLDAHPDKSITFNQTMNALLYINSTFTEDSKKWHDGFKVFRLAKVEGSKSVYFTNEEMKEFGFSSEQYETMVKVKAEREKGGLEINGIKVINYPQFVRARLQSGVESPLIFLETAVQELGYMFRERELFVQEGWQEVLANGPIVFPNESSSENIYQAEGRWEVWSSPSSDADRKQKYNYLASRLEEMVLGFPNTQQYDYQGFNSKEDLINQLLEAKEILFSQQIVHYKNSQGKDVALTLQDIEQRLFDLSFDPNHPPELRWGAPEGSGERYNMKLIKVPLNTGESLDSLKAYELERGLRYYPTRQSGSTSLNPEDNPKNPPFGLINECLKKHLIH